MCGEKERSYNMQGGNKIPPCVHVRVHTLSGYKIVRRTENYAKLHEVYLCLLWRRGIIATALLLTYLAVVLLGGDLHNALSSCIKVGCTLGLLAQCALLPTGLATTEEGYILDINAAEQPCQRETGGEDYGI